MHFKLNNYKRKLSDEEIIEDIKRVAKDQNSDYVSLSTYKEFGKHSQTAIQAHFGTWTNALKLAGLRSKRNQNERNRLRDEDYFADLRRVADLIGCETVSLKSYDKYGNHSSGNIFRRFGTWNNALLLAGLKETGFSKERISEQQCFDEIERLWLFLGRQPTTTDLIRGKASVYSLDTFKRRFGGWRNALKAFVDYIDSDDSKSAFNNDTQDPETESDIIVSRSRVDVDSVHTKQQRLKAHRSSRNVNARLRYEVLKRDNFKCCTCGASPAKDPSVELHVDHIIPWSKGGETNLDNLQTLCSKCNLGKSDRL